MVVCCMRLRHASPLPHLLKNMAMAQRLKEEYPDTWVHTHLCENKDEIAWVKSLYPDHDGYS